ncbi:hypothetical protein LTR53_009461 [Teratosphaeriaceae sp. CCFEE 6253]|nr:hypothetical protein LTR53_009461 [Teratosphaeriaceae sp. CCFEE 6253]
MSNITSVAAAQQQHAGPSLLLGLPIELQLQIYELAVTEPDTLILNRACNSSYRGRSDQMKEDAKAWAAGSLHGPRQPTLTKTSRLLRNLTLPMFYRENTFQAHYCHGASFDTAVEWLTAIGPRNRGVVKKLFLYDRNESQDYYSRGDITRAKQKLGLTFDATVEPIMAKSCSYHHVAFPEPGSSADGDAKSAAYWRWDEDDYQRKLEEGYYIDDSE